jgi:GGDEF domain-containing protein
VTASVGFTLVDGDCGVYELLAAADRELRRAKRDGKERWAV